MWVALDFASQVLTKAANDYQEVMAEFVAFRPSDSIDWSAMKRKMGGLAARKNAVPRNLPCPCGSGKKYRWCHGTSKANK
jgi:uncharacterized protein YecA (UPF0149 family)